MLFRYSKIPPVVKAEFFVIFAPPRQLVLYAGVISLSVENSSGNNRRTSRFPPTFVLSRDDHGFNSVLKADKYIHRHLRRAEPTVPDKDADRIFFLYKRGNIVNIIINAFIAVGKHGIENPRSDLSAVYVKFVISEPADICARPRYRFSRMHGRNKEIAAEYDCSARCRKRASTP